MAVTGKLRESSRLHSGSHGVDDGGRMFARDTLHRPSALKHPAVRAGLPGAEAT
jgi:hypothetical protein